MAVQALQGATNAASAKRPPPVVPLAHARKSGAKKIRCFGERVVKHIGHSRGVPLLEAPPPVSGPLQQAALQQPVAGIQLEWGANSEYDFALSL